MKRLLTYVAFLMIIAFSNIFAVENEILLGQGYANDVWYSFKNGVVKTDPTTNWDIGFMTYSQNAGIILNTAKGCNLYVVKNSDGDSWDTPIDTTGMSSTWEKGNNSIEKWHVGAFNLGQDGFDNGGDFGWGSYDMSTHAIAGSKVFVVKLSATSYKKMMIESLLGGIYTFLVANLDGSDEAKITLKKTDYPGKLYTYMELTTNKIIQREPDYDKWDLVFGKYTDLIDMGNGTFTPYTVTGVRTHPVYRTAVVKKVPTSQSVAPALNDDNYLPKLTGIGSGWKKLNKDYTYSVVDSVSYFVTADENESPSPLIYKIVFKLFEGSATGKILFNLSEAVTSVDEELVNSLNIFPSMVDKNSKVNVVFGEFNAEDLRSIRLFNTAGNLVQVINPNQNLSSGNFEISLSEISSGEYFMIFEFKNSNLMKKIIVK